MQERTMDIKEFNSKLEAEQADYKIPLTPGEADHLKQMNRAQRRRWLKAERKLGRFPHD